MTEATWGEGAKTPEIDWRMSAALQNVPRGDDELAEVTSLEGAVRAWLELDADHQGSAVLTPEHPLLIDGAKHTTLSGESIAALADQLPDRSGG
jgi:hypothetical protein